MKIILNKCFGGFDVSPQGYELYAKKKGFELYKYKDNLDFRNREYIKLKDEENELFKHYFTKDKHWKAVFEDCINKNISYIEGMGWVINKQNKLERA